MTIFESQDDYELQGKINFQGLIIDVENKKGSYRTGKDSNGKEWRTYMHFPYGRIRHTSTNSDEEEMDVYVGDNRKSDKVYQIKQMKSPKFEEFDEFKYMLGFDNVGEAVHAYLNQYDDVGYFGGVTEIPFKDFKEKIENFIDSKAIEEGFRWEQIVND